MSNLPFKTLVKTKYGAPIGRGSDKPSFNAQRVTIHNVPIDSGGYDDGGAYWGIGQTIFAFIDSDGGIEYSRHASSRAAIDHALENYAPETVVTFEPIHSTIYWHLAECADCGELVSFPSESETCGLCNCGNYIEGDAIIETESERWEYEG